MNHVQSAEEPNQASQQKENNMKKAEGEKTKLNSMNSYHFSLACLIAAMLVQGITTCYFSYVERQAIETALAKETTVIAEIQKVHTQFNALARKTIVLAENGNQNATDIIEQFKAAGLKFPTPTQ